jgi:hypothetical protein
MLPQNSLTKKQRALFVLICIPQARNSFDIIILHYDNVFRHMNQRSTYPKHGPRNIACAFQQNPSKPKITQQQQQLCCHQH